MNRMRFNMAYDVATLTILFESALKWFLNFQNGECTSGSNYILMNIYLDLLVWFHYHQGLLSIAANYRVPRKFQLDLAAVRLIHYSHVDIFYFCMKRERHELTWNTEKKLLTLILKYIFDQISPHQMEFPRDIIYIIWEFSF